MALIGSQLSKLDLNKILVNLSSVLYNVLFFPIPILLKNSGGRCVLYIYIFKVIEDYFEEGIDWCKLLTRSLIQDCQLSRSSMNSVHFNAPEIRSNSPEQDGELQHLQKKKRQQRRVRRSLNSLFKFVVRVYSAVSVHSTSSKG